MRGRLCRGRRTVLNGSVDLLHRCCRLLQAARLCLGTGGQVVIPRGNFLYRNIQLTHFFSNIVNDGPQVHTHLVQGLL